MPAPVSPVVAASALRAGGVIAYPTEAVWGLGCDPFDETAVRRLLAIKQRSIDKGLILIAASGRQLDGLIDRDAIPPMHRDAMRASWPGPHTWIVPATARVPRWITGAHDGVAVRVSAHPVVIALCEAFGGAIVSTSANRTGAPPPRTITEVDPALRAALDALVDGDTGDSARPSTIRDVRSGRLLRD
ncbi:MAG: L-threonylcarbamoyladenylate synthase [Luteimonas sp.]